MEATDAPCARPAARVGHDGRMATRRLLLLRHAKSSWDEPHLADHDRPLSGRGRRAARALLDHLTETDAVPELVLCSSAVRTMETLDGIRGALPPGTTIEIEGGLYAADVDELLARLRRVSETVGSAMLIGHNPGLEDLAMLLVGAGDAAARSAMEAKFPTAALAHLSVDGPWRELAPGVATLGDFWTPR